MATLYILYGSATGNAEHIAKDLASKPPPSPFVQIECLAMEKFKKFTDTWRSDPSSSTVLHKHGLICITSTTGNGDAPENASRFVRYLKRKSTLDTMPFAKCAYCVLGLGDTNYDKFCEAGKVVDRKLAELGGTRVQPLAMADEATGLEEVVEPWVDAVLADMATACTLSTNEEEEEEKDRDDAQKEEPTTTTPSSTKVEKSLRVSKEQKIVQQEEKSSSSPAASNKQTTPTNSLGSKPSTIAAATPPAIASKQPMPATTTATTETAASSNQQTLPTDSSGSTKPPAIEAATPPAIASKQPNPATTTSETPATTETAAASPSGSFKPSSSSTSPLIILYGSATGNAEQIAKDLAANYEILLKNPDATCWFTSVTCVAANDYKKVLPSDKNPTHKHGLIVVISTTGNGDAPENASRFVRYLKRKSTLDSMPFHNTAFGVLGLGDTNYDSFCATGKIVDRKLAELGGTRVLPLAQADEATGLEDVVEPWTSNIFVEITNACRAGASDETEESATATPLSAPLSTSNQATSTNDEEKKMDAPMDPKNNSSNKNTVVGSKTTRSRGVENVCALLSASSSSAVCDDIPTVTHSCLPALGTSLSSCELVHEEDEVPRRKSRGMSLAEQLDHMTISSASSTALHYTVNRPYETSILHARYLTKTSVKGAQAVCNNIQEGESLDQDAVMIRSMDILNEHFPLEGGDSEEMERNGKRVIEMTLALPDDYTLEYKPGDSLGLVVPNTPLAVQFVLNMLKQNHDISPSQKVSVDSNHPVTVEYAIRHLVDLCTPLKPTNKRILHSLSQFATDSEEEQVLRLLASKTPQGEELFGLYVETQRMSVVDLLREFNSCQSIPLQGLLGILPGIPPRYYSVSSSPLDKSKHLCLTVAFSVVDYQTPPALLHDDDFGSRRVGGVATRYLEVLCCPLLCNNTSCLIPKLKVFPKPTSEFRLPATLNTPLILIGPGTGIAPFMGFLSHRRAQTATNKNLDAANSLVEGTWRGGYEVQANELPVSKRDASGLVLGQDYQQSKDNAVGPVHVFFGCRHEHHDWLYEMELKQFAQERIITQLHTAFSRDGTGSNGRPRYVQNVMQQDTNVASTITDLILHQNASIYVCGDGNAMGRDVQATIVELIAKEQGGVKNNQEDAKEYLEQMKVHKRFVMDIWSN